MTATPSTRRRTRRAAALGAGALILAVLLSGCINLTADLTVDSQARVSGTERVEVSKQAASLLGITSLDALKQGAADDLQGASTSTDDCPSIEYGETDTAFTIVCTFNETALTSGDIVSTRTGDTIQFAFTQSGSESSSGSSDSGSDTTTITPDPTTTGGVEDLLGGSGNVGVLDVTVSFPGPIQTIAGASAAKATKVDDNTVQIKATATENISVQVTSGIDSGIVASLTGDDSSSFPWWILLVAALLLVAVLGALVAVLVSRSKKPADAPVDPYAPIDPYAPVDPTLSDQATPAPAASAAPTAPAGWYADPVTGEGQRYWDGSAWSDVPPPPAPAPPG